MWKLFRRFFYALLTLLLVIAIGTFGYWFLSGYRYPLFDTFYMTMITITTIGYGEVINVSQMPYGRPFTIIIGLSGISIFTFILTNFTAFLISGQITNSLRLSRTIKKAAKMTNHYIICGSGDIGFQIAEELISTKRDFVIIDKSDIDIMRLDDSKTLFIKGDATDESVLNQASIMTASGLFAVTGDDNYNLVITFTAKQIKSDLRVIAKCRETQHIEKMKKAGADSVISPYLIGGLRMVSEMVRPRVVTFLDTMLRDKDRSYRIEEIPVREDFIGKSIASLELAKQREILLLSVRTENDWNFNPDSSYVLCSNDVLIFMCTPDGREYLAQIRNKS